MTERLERAERSPGTRPTMTRIVVMWRALAAAMAVGVVPVLGVTLAREGRITLPGDGWAGAVPVVVLLVVFLLMGLKSERRRYESAVPLADPAAVLPDPSVVRRALLKGMAPVAAVIAVMGVVMVLLMQPMVGTVFATFPIGLLLRAERTARWERKHGVLLWQGNAAQPAPGSGGRAVRRVMPQVYTSPRTETAPGRD
ncbi:hypothetical protein ACFVTY_23255 [Streptomyces sp. NPDC058067]|uniref:hypothetical protein n=1 Tax=Streptomyces sp. NPDC058067 TaxID=3346324 RepID=UPI0036E4794C